MSLITAQFTKGNGHPMALGKAKDSRSGETAQNTKDIGEKTRQTAMAELFIPMGMPTSESGRMIKRMAEALMNILMGQSILAIGSRINSMAMGLRCGQMEALMKAIMNLEKNMALEHFNGSMEVLILENFIVIIYMAWGCTLGKMVESMKENGEQIKCMAMALSSG